ncbi:hypothetical protein NDU88_006371 [Pleurodeles waltl]|uniref:Uncharacterized protein n=1 Tax=Pleurodeles waltl TaxID=8319 RepID=A0AAV7ULF5_PLEWA|nr:hypothetical protein NDU88_006371 [Pleurodeles waltl]
MTLPACSARSATARPPARRHVVGVKGREADGPSPTSRFILPLHQCWWNERCMCVEGKNSALAGLLQPPPETPNSQYS